jgi:hypothetical protein
MSWQFGFGLSSVILVGGCFIFESLPQRCYRGPSLIVSRNFAMVDTNGIGTFQPFLLVTLGFPVGTTMNTVRLPTANEDYFLRDSIGQGDPNGEAESCHC